MSHESWKLNEFSDKPLPETVRPLQGHQRISIEKLNKTFTFSDQIGKGGLLVLPTGGGKTLTTVRWLYDFALGKGVKVLWLAHTFHLLDQVYATFKENRQPIPKRDILNIRVVSSNPSHCRARDISIEDDVLIITTLTAYENLFHETKDQSNEVIDSEFTKFLKCNQDQRLIVVLDEAHHAPAYGCRTLLLQIREMQPSAYFLGLTATPDYTDESRKGWFKVLFEDWIIHKEEKTALQALGILAIEKLIQKKTDFKKDLDEKTFNRLVREHKDLPEDIIKELATNSPRNDFIVQEYLKNRKEYKKTLIFADHWKQALYLKDKLKKADVNAGAVFSYSGGGPDSADARNHMTSNEIKETIEKFKGDGLEVLINIRMLTEGTDVPTIKTVFITRETTSRILLTQMIGRALRGPKSGGGPDKNEANIVFFTDTWNKFINWASFSPEGGTEETEKVVGRYPMEMISINLVEALIQQIHSGTSYQAEPFTDIVPVGWYTTRYFSDNGIGGPDWYTEFAMVYNHQESKFKQFIQGLQGKIPNAWEKDDLSQEWIKENIKPLSSPYFDLQNDDIGNSLETNLIRIVRHMARSKEAPEFTPLSERDKLDLDKVAERLYLTGNALEQKQALEIIYNSPESLWKSFYKSFDYFKSAYDRAVNRLLYLKESNKPIAAKLEKQVLTPVDANRVRELTEQDKEKVLMRDGYKCLCCGAEKSRQCRLQVDHIRPFRISGDTSFENSQTLCRECNAIKKIDIIDFRLHDIILKNEKDFQIFQPTNFDDYQTYVRRIVNFYYNCQAVAGVRKQCGTNGKKVEVLVVQLYPGNDPTRLLPHDNELTTAVRNSELSGCTSISRLIVNPEKTDSSLEISECAAEQSQQTPIDSLLVNAADTGDVHAMLEIANKYLDSDDPADQKKGVQSLRKAAEKDTAEALRKLGLCYYDGTGTARNLHKAKESFLLAAAKGDSEAQYQLGQMYLSGEGGKKDVEQFLKWTNQAAQQGHRESLNQLGIVYHDGKDVKRDYAQAFSYYKKAAELDEPFAMNNLGILYQYGYGVPKNLDEAVKWFRKAADKNNPWGYYNLGLLSSKDQDGFSENLENAYIYFSLAVEFSYDLLDGTDQGVIARAKTRIKKKINKKQLDEAEKKIEKLLEMMPQNQV
ncbi:MAG: DEAD/DEAH box helicase family protein [Candidatus Wallbacteria bacterium]|nr:DEAD/DEAH box helicase family protein [Candidatus Wallbacteria bacterium]